MVVALVRVDSFHECNFVAIREAGHGMREVDTFQLDDVLLGGEVCPALVNKRKRD